jgi:hypothetical protein
MRVRPVLLLALLAAFSAGAARAENVGISVAVDVADLDPQVSSVGITCMVCTVDCEIAGGTQVIGTGSSSAVISASGHAYQGTVAVVVPTSSAKGTDYLCRMSVASASASFIAGAGPDWTLPEDGAPFTNMLKGKLPATTKQPVVATKCKNGGEPINGKCPGPSVASTPPQTCPNGQPMPANGNCGFVGPTINLPGLLQIFSSCPGGKQKLADGSCPASDLPSPNINKQVLACADGQPRMKNGMCPEPKPAFKSQNFLKFLGPQDPNAGLR